MADYDLEGFLRMLIDAGIKDPTQEIYEYLCPIDRVKLKAVWDDLETARSVKPRNKVEQGKRASMIGALYEKFLRELLRGCLALKFDKVISSNSLVAQIDVLLTVEPLAKALEYLRNWGSHVIGEAKCYKDPPQAKWISQLAGILPLHSAKAGILFVASPPKKLSSEIRYDIAMNAGQQKFIVPMGVTQLESVMNGAPFLEVLGHQFVAAMSHSSKLSV